MTTNASYSTQIHLPHYSHLDLEIQNQSNQPICCVNWGLDMASKLEFVGGVESQATRKAAWYFCGSETMVLPNFSFQYQFAGSTLNAWEFELDSKSKAAPLTKLVLTIFSEPVEDMACKVDCYSENELLANYFFKRNATLGSSSITPVLTANSSASHTRSSSAVPTRRSSSSTLMA